jgi:hypothetical protein
MKRNEIWIKVTRDKYELPVAVADSVQELSAMTGHSVQTIRSIISRQKHGRIKFSQFIRIPVEEEM